MPNNDESHIKKGTLTSVESFGSQSSSEVAAVGKTLADRIKMRLEKVLNVVNGKGPTDLGPVSATPKEVITKNNNNLAEQSYVQKEKPTKSAEHILVPSNQREKNHQDIMNEAQLNPHTKEAANTILKKLDKHHENARKYEGGIDKFKEKGKALKNLIKILANTSQLTELQQMSANAEVNRIAYIERPHGADEYLAKLAAEIKTSEMEKSNNRAPAGVPSRDRTNRVR